MTPTIKTTREGVVRVPGTAMTNLDILYYVEKIQLPNFVGVFMRDTLPSSSWNRNAPQFGIMNLNKANQIGVHWVGWGCIPNNGIYFFDSFGADVPIELLRYLRTKEELAKNESLIRQNTYVVQKLGSSECGRLSLFVLKCLSKNIPFDKIIQVLKIRYDDATVAGSGENRTADQMDRSVFSRTA